MSLRDSLLVAAQTLISNGFGASVGLEAAYAQIGGALASLAGRRAQPAAQRPAHPGRRRRGRGDRARRSARR